MGKLEVKVQVLLDWEVVEDKTLNFPADILELKREREFQVWHSVGDFVQTWIGKSLEKIDDLLSKKPDAEAK